MLAEFVYCKMSTDEHHADAHVVADDDEAVELVQRKDNSRYGHDRGGNGTAAAVTLATLFIIAVLVAYDRSEASSIAADISLNTIRTDVHAQPENFDPETRERHCAELMDRFGFWSQEQCTLWYLIETNATIDMSPYLASNIPQKEKWWSPTTPTDPPGSGRNGRIIYHLHLHKAAGTSFCSWFKEARQLNGNRTSVRPTTNPKDNCNVPTEWWMDKNKSMYGFQYGAYIGATREQMRSIYANIRQQDWIYVASEGSIEEQPIFGLSGPYFYTTILRDPFQWVVSMWHFDNAYNRKNHDLDKYLREYLWGTPQFFTRRLCGVQCVREPLLTHEHFLRAKSMLDHYDLVLAQEVAMADPSATLQLLKKSFPTLSFPSIGSPRNSGKYNRDVLFTVEQLDFIRNHTLMDKVLYEYAKILHKRKLMELDIVHNFVE